MYKTELIAGAVIAAVALYFWMDVKAGAKAAVTAVNPASQDNLVNKGVEAIGKAVSGSDSWTLGGMIFDWTHPNANAELLKPMGKK